MKSLTFCKLSLCGLIVLLVTGCVTTTPHDYTAFKAHQPKSILVLPPLNNSPDVRASYSFLSTASYPLAESGYYVFPVAVVDQTFKENGLTQAADIHQVPAQKLRDIFGADAALYITIEKYGASYTVFDSAVVVSVKANLIDLKTSTTLWTGKASASSNEGNNQSNNGLIGMLITAIVQQAINSAGDKGHEISILASNRLLTAGPNGLLFGPYSPQFGKDTPK